MFKTLTSNNRTSKLLKAFFIISLFVVKNSSLLLLFTNTLLCTLRDNFNIKRDFLFFSCIFLLAAFFILNSFFHINSSPGCLLNIITEGKFIFFLCSLYFYHKAQNLRGEKLHSRDIKYFADIFILGSFAYIFIAYVTMDKIFRFPNYLGFSTDINSSSYGFIVLILLIASKDLLNFLVLSILLIISGSGSCLVAYLYVLFSKRNFLFKNISFLGQKNSYLLIIAIFSAITMFFLLGQSYRHRSIFNIMSIDRVNIFIAYINYLGENLNIYSALFGNGPFVLVVDMMKFVPTDEVRNYLWVEPGIMGARVLHNDFLRIFHTYGLLGIGVLFLFIKRLKYLWFKPILIVALFGSPFFSTPLFVFLNFYFFSNFLYGGNRK